MKDERLVRKFTVCKHCFEPESQHHAHDKWCPYRSEHGHFTHWDHEHYFEDINIFKEVERLKNWQTDATVVLNKWYLVSDFLAKNNLVGLGESYPEKCIEVLKELMEDNKHMKKLITEALNSLKG